MGLTREFYSKLTLAKVEVGRKIKEALAAIRHEHRKKLKLRPHKKALAARWHFIKVSRQFAQKGRALAAIWH